MNIIYCCNKLLQFAGLFSKGMPVMNLRKAGELKRIFSCVNENRPNSTQDIPKK